jgi:predicted lipid-binding transport protein (Tim44 family)
MFSDTLASSSA